jgi:hypothetical protein
VTARAKTITLCLCAAFGIAAWILLPTFLSPLDSLFSAAYMVVLGIIVANVFSGGNGGEHHPASPAQEAETALVTHGQRKINLIWEYTQAIIALLVVVSNLLVGVQVGLSGGKSEVPPMLSNALFLVVGFYFSRTNHAAIGGVGKKPTDEYRGR